MSRQDINMVVDAVIFSVIKNDICVLLICRKNEPFKGKWALPGGFVENQETLLEAAKRELKEETNLEIETLDFVGLYDEPKRDPRGRFISAAFWTSLSVEEVDKINLKAASDAAELKWLKVESDLDLAFDHLEIVKDAFKLYNNEL